MKKILHLSKYYAPYFGGIESVVKDLAVGCNDKHHSVDVLCFSKSDCATTSVDGVSVIYKKENFNLASTPFSAKYLIWFLNNYHNYDIIHCHAPNPFAFFTIFIAMLFTRFEPKVIIHWHSDIVNQKYLFYLFYPIQRFVLDRCSSIIVTSERYCNFSEQLSNYRHKCIVIPIGIKPLPEPCDSAVEDIMVKYPGRKIILSLGRHIYYKGFEDLIESVQHTDQSFVFLIGGVGPDTQKYERLISLYGLSSRIFLVGRISEKELSAYFKAAYLFCLSSNQKSEAFGVVQLEAMSFGIPVVSCNIEGSGVSWVNQHQVSGLICQPNSPSLLAACFNALTDVGERNRMGKRASTRFNELFTSEVMCAAILELYDKT